MPSSMCSSAKTPRPATLEGPTCTGSARGGEQGAGWHGAQASLHAHAYGSAHQGTACVGASPQPPKHQAALTDTKRERHQPRGRSGQTAAAYAATSTSSDSRMYSCGCCIRPCCKLSSKLSAGPGCELAAAVLRLPSPRLGGRARVAGRRCCAGRRDGHEGSHGMGRSLLLTLLQVAPDMAPSHCGSG